MPIPAQLFVLPQRPLGERALAVPPLGNMPILSLQMFTFLLLESLDLCCRPPSLRDSPLDHPTENSRGTPNLSHSSPLIPHPALSSSKALLPRRQLCYCFLKVVVISYFLFPQSTNNRPQLVQLLMFQGVDAHETDTRDILNVRLLRSPKEPPWPYILAPLLTGCVSLANSLSL